MSLLAALKVFCDLTLVASAASVVIPWFSMVPGNFLPAMAVCAMGVLLGAFLQKRGILRFAGAVPCLGALALCSGVVDTVVVIPMIAYSLWTIASGAFHISYDEYRDFFKIGAIFHSACFLFAGVNMDWVNMLPYMALYFLTAVFLLRNLRLGAAGSGRNMVLNLVSFLVTLLLGVMLCLVGYTALCLLRYPAGALYFGFMEGFLEIFREAVYFVGEILTYIVAYFAALMYRNRNGEVNMDSIGGGEEPVEPPQEIEPNVMVNTIAGVVLILIVAIAVVALARKGARMMKKRITAAGRRTYTQRIAVGGDRRGEKVTGNRAKVRAVYRKFLGLVVERGEEIRPDHTSKDVLHLASLVADGGDCSALRDVYLSARYDTTREVTGEQVKEAKNLYNKLKQSKD